MTPGERRHLVRVITKVTEQAARIATLERKIATLERQLAYLIDNIKDTYEGMIAETEDLD